MMRHVMERKRIKIGNKENTCLETINSYETVLFLFKKLYQAQS